MGEQDKKQKAADAKKAKDKADAKAAGVIDAAGQAKVASTGAAATAEEAKVAAARKVVAEKKSIFKQAERAFKLAKPAYMRAEHALALLTGEAKEGESYEEFAKRKEANMHKDAEAALAALNAAKQVASAANAAARELWLPRRRRRMSTRPSLIRRRP